MILEVRAARREDVAGIHRLMRELAEFEELTGIFVATADDLAEALFGQPAAAEALVASRADQLVGYAVFFHNFSTFIGKRGLYLEDIYVQPEHRGDGIGRALLRAVAAIAVERRCARFEWSVLDWNQHAIDFYQAMGATVMPEWRIVRATGNALQQLAGKP